jgi:hypothetical protein
VRVGGEEKRHRLPRHNEAHAGGPEKLGEGDDQNCPLAGGATGMGPEAGVAGLCVPGELLKGAAQELGAEAEDAAERQEDALRTD